MVGLPPKLSVEKFVTCTSFHVEQLHRKRFEQAFHDVNLGEVRAALLCRQRNDVIMYGKLYSEYPADTPEYMTMAVTEGATAPCRIVSSPAVCLPKGNAHAWEATLIQRPLHEPVMQPGTPGFLAMNRFVIKPDEPSRRRFEERWATRRSQLAGQEGLVGFSLLRRACPPDADAASSDRFTYATATLWVHQAAWAAWRCNTRPSVGAPLLGPSA